jgi:hypothetical protein
MSIASVEPTLLEGASLLLLLARTADDARQASEAWDLERWAHRGNADYESMA